jgi:hypothetical protein
MKSKLYIIAFCILMLIAGCGKDFLQSPEVQKDPNRATEVSADQLFNAIQVKAFYMQENNLSRITSLWMQQMSGTDRQAASLAAYITTESTTNPEMTDVYTTGGLVDIKTLRAETEAKGNRVYSGIVKFYEALMIGTASSLWGDLPYSEACTDVEMPGLDRMQDIYAALQALLDEAIADLQSGDAGIDLASPINDVVYNGDAQKWTQACYSLKARLCMHWAEVDASNYARAMSAAQSGISTWANDFKSFHQASLFEEFGWYNYFEQRDSYIRASQYLVELLKSRNDPRLAIYFEPAATGEIIGSGVDEANVDASTLSTSVFLNPAHSFDILTWEETQLIIAECAYHAGDQATALDKINEVRRGIEGKWGLAADALGTAAGLEGAALFDKIMEEKHIALFLNIETYNDWKRTKLPVLVPYGGGNPETVIPHRLYYGEYERNSNANIPPPSAQPLRNENDPN